MGRYIITIWNDTSDVVGKDDEVFQASPVGRNGGFYIGMILGKGFRNNINVNSIRFFLEARSITNLVV